MPWLNGVTWTLEGEMIYHVIHIWINVIIPHTLRGNASTTMTALSMLHITSTIRTHHIQNVLYSPSPLSQPISINTLCTGNTITTIILAFTRISQWGRQLQNVKSDAATNEATGTVQREYICYATDKEKSTNTQKWQWQRAGNTAKAVLEAREAG